MDWESLSYCGEGILSHCPSIVVELEAAFSESVDSTELSAGFNSTASGSMLEEFELLLFVRTVSAITSEVQDESTLVIPTLDVVVVFLMMLLLEFSTTSEFKFGEQAFADLLWLLTAMAAERWLGEVGAERETCFLVFETLVRRMGEDMKSIIDFIMLIE